MGRILRLKTALALAVGITMALATFSIANAKEPSEKCKKDKTAKCAEQNSKRSNKSGDLKGKKERQKGNAGGGGGKGEGKGEPTGSSYP